MLWRWILLTIGSALTLMHGAMPVPVVSAGDGAVVAQRTAECTVSSATGAHSSVESRYTVKGVCGLYDNGYLDRVHAITWSADGSHQPNTKATFETFTMILVTSGDSVETGSINSTMQCGTDPWRQAPSAPCRFPVRQAQITSPSGNLNIVYQDHEGRLPGLPLSVLLSPAQRASLEKQYRLSLATRQKPGALGPGRDQPRTPLSPASDAGRMTTLQRPGQAAGPVSSADPVLQAKHVQNYPTIRLPAGGVVVQGELYVRIQEPQVGTTPVTEVEWTWLDAPPEQPYVNTFADDTKKLRNRTKVDVAVTRGQFGRWQVRARMRGQAASGPWSPPTFFTLVAMQPTQSLTIPPPNPAMLYAPNEPFGIDGQRKRSSSGTGSFRPQTTPQQGIGETTLIRPRGVEGKDDTRSNEAVGTSPETEKKP